MCVQFSMYLICCVYLEGDLKYCSAVWAWDHSHPSVFYREWACYNALSSGLCNMWQYFHDGRIFIALYLFLKDVLLDNVQIVFTVSVVFPLL